ncbi:cyclin-dependent kinase inhibitor 3-like [Primulina eburnea]|uniref:cyclin-dependent kinase inhibitor 3-like n=1 Tax=Primulina eburnea TaxID=1245227 RepID=UPI003C6CC45C
MGKYMKKSKSPGEVGVKDDASQSSLGICTRAKTLALRHLQSSSSGCTPLKRDLGYLELRSRRLVKRPPLLRKCLKNSRIVSSADNNGFTGEEYGGFGSRKACSESGSVGPGKGEDACLLRKSRGLESGDLGIEVSFGENYLESEGGERSNREITHCSLIMVAESSTISGSTMKQASIAPAASQRVQNSRLLDMPTTAEVEEFFAHKEQLWQRLFMEKYNFDIVNDLPLPGRYKWVKKSP